MRVDSATVRRYRLAVNHLAGARLPLRDLAVAARCGLQDSSPLSGLLSLAARVDGVGPATWRDERLAQVFGPRGAIYLVPRSDVAVFTLGVLPADAAERRRAFADAAAIADVLGGEPMTQREVLGRMPSLEGARSLRRAAATGTLLAVWDAVDTLVVPAPAPTMPLETARTELARRFFRHLGPASIRDLRWWLATTTRDAADSVQGLDDELTAVTTDGTERLITADSVALLADPPEPPPLLLLPADDPFIARTTTRDHGAETAATLWPKAPPPGAVVADGAVIGTWRRRGAHVSVHTRSELSPRRRRLAEETAATFPLPGAGEVSVSFDTG